MPYSKSPLVVLTRTVNPSASGRDTLMLPDVLPEGEGTVYAALTGDLCALTNIRIRKARNV